MAAPVKVKYKLEKDLCRCCHAEGAFYKLSDPVYNFGQKELYSDMLKTSLDITILPVPGPLHDMTFTICESCVLRLRDAHNFKQQVALCEQRFTEMYKDIVVDTEVVKQEVTVTFENEVKKEIADDDDTFEMRYEDSDDNQPVIKIKVEDSRKAKAKANARAKKKVTKAPPKDTSSSAPAEETPQEKPAPKKPIGRRTAKFALKEADYRTEGGNYVCAICDKKYDKFFSLRFHIKTKHYKIPRYSCPYCSQEFMTPAPLTIHKLEQHDVDDRFKCKACNAAFNTKVQLRKHTNNFHMLGEKYKCEFCEYESFSFEGMYKHKFKHRTEKNYHCKFCNKSFLRKATLDLHERIHTGDRRKVCKLCGQAFVQKASLNYHMTKYHPEVNF